MGLADNAARAAAAKTTQSKTQSSSLLGSNTASKPNTVGPLKSGYVAVPAAKTYSGPGIDPKTGKSTVKADQAKAAQAAVIALTSGKTLTAAQKNILGMTTTTKPTDTKPVTTKPTTKPVTTKPVVTKPVATKPEPASSPAVEVPDPAPTVVQDIYPTPGPSSTSEDPVVTPPPVKSAPIDTVIFIDEEFSNELITDLLFEDVGGQELLTIARNDTVNGQQVIYQPFKNLGILQEIYNPTTLLRLQETSDKFFSNFTINLRDRIPKVGSGENGANYYLDLASGEGVIEFINLRADEQVEVQIASTGIIEDVGI